MSRYTELRGWIEALTQSRHIDLRFGNVDDEGGLSHSAYRFSPKYKNGIRGIVESSILDANVDLEFGT